MGWVSQKSAGRFLSRRPCLPCARGGLVIVFGHGAQSDWVTGAAFAATAPGIDGGVGRRFPAPQSGRESTSTIRDAGQQEQRRNPDAQGAGGVKLGYGPGAGERLREAVQTDRLTNDRPKNFL